MTPHPPPPEGFESWIDYVLNYSNVRLSERLDARSELARLRRIEKAARVVDRGWGPGIASQDEYNIAREELHAALEEKT